MKKTLAILMAGATVWTACESGPKFRVEGTVEDAKDSMLYLV